MREEIVVAVGLATLWIVTIAIIAMFMALEVVDKSNVYAVALFAVLAGMGCCREVCLYLRD